MHSAKLRDPVVLIAFTGWNDAGEAASDVLQHLIDTYPGTPHDAIADERYFDFHTNRPMLNRAADGPWVAWPSIDVRVVHHPQRDLVIFLGPEPNLLWRSFSQELIDRVADFCPSLVLLLGAMLSDTPHSRPLPVGLYTLDPVVENRYRIEPSDYTGPLGMLGVAAQAMLHRRIPAASMWVCVPHYVAAPPSPKAQEALLLELEHVLELSFDSAEIPAAARSWEGAVNELSLRDPEIAEYIGQLEEQRDEEEVAEATGETIAAELERYLKTRRDQGHS